MMGKCVASGYAHPEITICNNCFHHDVCMDMGYLSDNDCCNFVERGMVFVKPCNRGDGIFCIIGSHYGKEKKIEERTVRGMRLLDYEKQPNSWTVSVHPTQQNDANLQFIWGRGAFATHAEAEAALKGVADAGKP